MHLSIIQNVFLCHNPLIFPRSCMSIPSLEVVYVTNGKCSLMIRFEMCFDKNIYWCSVSLYLWIVTHFLSDLFSLRTSSACTFGLHYLFAQTVACTQRSIRGSLPCFFVLPHLEEGSKNVRSYGNRFGERKNSYELFKVCFEGSADTVS